MANFKWWVGEGKQSTFKDLPLYGLSNLRGHVILRQVKKLQSKIAAVATRGQIERAPFVSSLLVALPLTSKVRVQSGTSYL